MCANEYPGLQLYLGAEVFFSEGIRRKLQAGIIPTLAGNDYVLVEFVPGVSKANLEKAVRHLANGGYVSVLAHAERYSAVTRDIKFAKYLKDKYGVLIQVNSETFLRFKSFYICRFIRKAMKSKLIDFVASDAHGIHSRRTRLKSASLKIAKDYGSTEIINIMKNAYTTFINNI